MFWIYCQVIQCDIALSNVTIFICLGNIGKYSSSVDIDTPTTPTTHSERKKYALCIFFKVSLLVIVLDTVVAYIITIQQVS